jgi:hypothetical protein
MALAFWLLLFEFVVVVAVVSVLLMALEKLAVTVSPRTGLAPIPAEYDLPLKSTTDAGFRIGTGTGEGTRPVGVISAFPLKIA